MACLAASHELIYLIAHGIGVEYVRAMQEGGHDRYWTSFVLTVAAVAAALALITFSQIRRLRHQASLVRAGRLSVDDRGYGLLARLIARLWLLVAAGTVVAFLGQENLETITAGHPLPGIDVISGEHAVALPVMVVTSLLVACVAALVRWGRHLLLARLRRSLGPARRPATRTLRPPFIPVPPAAVGVHSHGLRAPPGSSLSLA